MKNIINVKKLKQIVNLQASIQDQGKITFTKNGMYILDNDRAHVMMIEQTFPLHNSVEMEIGIDYYKLQAMLKNAKSTDIIEISQDIISLSANCLYNIKTIPVDGMPSPKLPIADMVAKVRINNKEFYNYLTRAVTLSDAVTISTDGKVVRLVVENDVDSLTKEYPLSQHIKKKCKSIFSVDYLIGFFKQYKNMFDDSIMYFGDDMLLKVESIQKSNIDKWIGFDVQKVVMMLAPRMEDI